MKTVRTLAPLALVVALALAGCSDDPADFGGDDGTEAGTSGGTDAGADGDDSGSGAVVDEIDPTDVITSYEMENLPRDAPEGSTVTIGVHSLQVKGDLMLLELYYTPTVGGDPSEDWDLYSMNGNNPIAPVLVDVPNLTQYETIRNPENVAEAWSTPVVGGGAISGETILWWGYYAAPPEGVDTIDIQVYQDHPRIEGVEIQR